MIKQFAAVVLLFVFCASSFAAEDPLAYIPDAKGYLGVNFDKAKSSPMLMDAFKTVIATIPSQDQAPDVPDSVKRAYYADPHSLMEPGIGTGIFTVVGLPGMVDDFLVEYRKTDTLTPDTINAGALGTRPGFAIANNGFIYPVGDSGIVVVQKSNLPALIAAAAAGRPAADNGGFQFVHGALDSHAVAAASAVDELMSKLAPTLMRVPGMPAGLDKATSSVVMASMWLDLVNDLSGEVNLHVADPQHSQVLIKAINHFLLMLNQGVAASGKDPDMQLILQGIKCSQSIYGVTIAVKIPQAVVTRLGARIKASMPTANSAGATPRSATPTPRVTGLTPTPVPTKIPPRR